MDWELWSTDIAYTLQCEIAGQHQSELAQPEKVSSDGSMGKALGSDG